MFPTLPRSFQRNVLSRHSNRKGLINQDYKHFIANLNDWLINDLSNAPNRLRISFSTMKKKHLKIVADYINDFIADQDENFLHIQWYIIALDIIESKLYKPPPEIMKKSVPKYKVNVNFSSKALDFINLTRILRSKASQDHLPAYVSKNDIPMVIYSLSKPIRSQLFNYHKFVSELALESFVNNMESVPCYCSNFNPSFVDQHHKHILTGDLNILGNIKLIDLFS